MVPPTIRCIICTSHAIMDRYGIHRLHSFFFAYNLQYFTWSDRFGGSYRHPDSALDPLLEVPKEKKQE